MIYGTCPVSGCGRSAYGRSPLCKRHRRNDSRHGHPTQAAVRPSDLAPLLKRIAARRKANPESPSWSLLAARWSTLTGYAERFLDEVVDAGEAHNKYERMAAEYVRTVARQADGQRVVDTALAVFMLCCASPFRFKSDTAVEYQASRRVRALSDVHIATYWSQPQQRTVRLYRDAPPRALAVLGAWLRQTFAAPAALLWELEARPKEDEEAKKRAEWEQLSGALGALR